MHVSVTLAAGVLLLLVEGCGGRTVLDHGGDDGGTDTDSGRGDDGGSGDDGPSGDDGASGDDGPVSTQPCISPEGVRFCGGNAACATPDAQSCPGGCNPAVRISGGASMVGVCWSDLADKGTRSCNECDDGEVCVYRAADQLICVPEDVCRSMWALGATDVCRYADKSAYDHKHLPAAPSSCPGGLAHKDTVCSGGCGPCLGTPCVGRSPLRPLGICPRSLDECRVSGSVIVTNNCMQGYLCAVFRDAPPDQHEAQRYGICMPPSTCASAAAVLPGGLDCIGGT